MTVVTQRTAIGYCRVSTPRQAAEGISLDNQKESIRRLCATKNLSLLTCYSDAGKSGRRLAGREQLESAVQVACESKGVLVVYSISRMSRSLKDVFTLSDRLEKSNAELVSVTEPIDTTNAIGRAFFSIVATLAQLESELTGERISSVNAHTVAELGYRRQGIQPFGYRLENGVRVVDLAEQKFIQKLVELRQSGLSYRKIVEVLHQRGEPTISRFRGWGRQTDKWRLGTLLKVIRRSIFETPRSGRTTFTEEELALLGTMSDSQLASRYGRLRTTITHKRKRLGIPSYRPEVP